MRGIIIQQTPDLILTSYGNGWAYKLEHTGLAQSVWVQEDDATAFREALDARETVKPEESALPYLWAEYEPVAQAD